MLISIKNILKLLSVIILFEEVFFCFWANNWIQMKNLALELSFKKKNSKYESIEDNHSLTEIILNNRTSSL
jgi:hypothetical protein